MRGAPHEHDVEHGEVETVEVVLCDDGEAPRRLLIGKIVQRAPVKTDCTLVRMLHAVDALEEHALAAAVRADDAEEFLIVQAEIHPFENLLPADEEFHGLCEYFHISCLQIRRYVSP